MHYKIKAKVISLKDSMVLSSRGKQYYVMSNDADIYVKFVQKKWDKSVYQAFSIASGKLCKHIFSF